MKIISPFKDYYDFVAGHDTDPRKVYIRKPSTDYISNAPYTVAAQLDNSLQDNENTYIGGSIWFCGVRYPFVKTFDGRFVYKGDELFDILEKAQAVKHRTRVRFGWYNISLATHFGWTFSSKKDEWTWKPEPRDTKFINPNMKYNAPVVIFTISASFNVLVNGRLKDYGFNIVKNPQEAFTDIYNFIPFNEPEMPSDPADMQRFEGKGFDKKTSFRNPVITQQGKIKPKI